MMNWARLHTLLTDPTYARPLDAEVVDRFDAIRNIAVMGMMPNAKKKEMEYALQRIFDLLD